MIPCLDACVGVFTTRTYHDVHSYSISMNLPCISLDIALNIVEILYPALHQFILSSKGTVKHSVFTSSDFLPAIEKIVEVKLPSRSEAQQLTGGACSVSRSSTRRLSGRTISVIRKKSQDAPFVYSFQYTLSWRTTLDTRAMVGRQTQTGWTPKSSTSKYRVASGGITRPAPLDP